MDKGLLTAFNIGMSIITFLVLPLTWFFMRDQFMWGISLVFLLMLFTGFADIMWVFPWQAMSADDVIVAVVAFGSFCSPGSICVSSFAGPVTSSVSCCSSSSTCN
ncbi:MAG: hypothetical protein A4E28_01531 [Methanocella sp. PtaU1.Bin125]|nr:MAG: hypothetical protein A4E28_01531 [Methanocella sp. PtaU1.Bin125]